MTVPNFWKSDQISTLAGKAIQGFHHSFITDHSADKTTIHDANGIVGASISSYFLFIN